MERVMLRLVGAAVALSAAALVQCGATEQEDTAPKPLMVVIGFEGRCVNQLKAVKLEFGTQQDSQVVYQSTIVKPSDVPVAVQVEIPREGEPRRLRAIFTTADPKAKPPATQTTSFDVLVPAGSTGRVTLAAPCVCLGYPCPGDTTCRELPVGSGKASCVGVSLCGDGTCSSSEDSNVCPADCGTACGDGKCDPGEECAADCGQAAGGSGGQGGGSGQGGSSGKGGAGAGGAGAGGAGAGGAGQGGGGVGGGGQGGAGGGAVCGDGKREGTEACDIADLGGQTCATVMGAEYEGKLVCSLACQFDTAECTKKPACGDDKCNGDETKCTCKKDCGAPGCGECGNPACASCGDGACNGGETKCTCAQDCGAPGCGECGNPACASCGDGSCNGGEDKCSCPNDCGNPGCGECGKPPCAVCGDGICNEDKCSCNEDCVIYCGECGTPNDCNPGATGNCTVNVPDACGPGQPGICPGTRTCNGACQWGSCVKKSGSCAC